MKDERPPVNSEKDHTLDAWGDAIAQAGNRQRMEEAARELEKTTPPDELPPLEEQPTHVMNPETGETDRVA